jgi:hypothetical protein
VGTANAERDRALVADPGFMNVMLRALNGDPGDLLLLDEDHVRVASRSISVVIAGRVGGAVADGPCALAGLTFWLEAGSLTFAFTDRGAPHFRLPVLVGQMLALDGNALLVHRDFGPATNDAWAALYECVPRGERRQFAQLLAGKFTAEPTPANPVKRRTDTSWRKR